jgi:hypothetical protein
LYFANELKIRELIGQTGQMEWIEKPQTDSILDFEDVLCIVLAGLSARGERDELAKIPILPGYHRAC